MLNLFYYDLKATLKKLWGYVILVAVLAFVVRLIWSGAISGNYADDNSLFYIATIINIVSLGALGLVGFLVSVAVIVSQAKWFDENILSPQGQLTNMFPVSSSQIILSKILTSVFWSIILVLMSLGVFSVFLVNTQRYDNIMSTIAEIGASNNISISFVQIIFSAAFFVITFITALIALCFLAQLMGQIFNSHRNLAVFVSFIFVLAISLFIMNLFCSILGISIANLSTSPDDIINFAISSANKLAFVNLLFVIVYWACGSYILKNHLNLM